MSNFEKIKDMVKNVNTVVDKHEATVDSVVKELLPAAHKINETVEELIRELSICTHSLDAFPEVENDITASEKQELKSELKDLDIRVNHIQEILDKLCDLSKKSKEVTTALANTDKYLEFAKNYK